MQDFVSSLKDFTFNTNISSWVHLKKDVKLVIADVKWKKSKSHDKNSVVCHPSLILNIDYSVYRQNFCWIVVCVLEKLNIFELQVHGLGNINIWHLFRSVVGNQRLVMLQYSPLITHWSIETITFVTEFHPSFRSCFSNIAWVLKFYDWLVDHKVKILISEITYSNRVSEKCKIFFWSSLIEILYKCKYSLSSKPHGYQSHSRWIIHEYE